jgi:hypothetical protein
LHTLMNSINMNNTGSSTSNVGIFSIKKLQIFRKCQCLVSRYVLTLQRIQEQVYLFLSKIMLKILKIYEEYGETEEQRQFFDEGFFNSYNLSTHHKPFCAAFAKCHERCETPRVEVNLNFNSILLKNQHLGYDG